jgi:hypothetical protein
MVEEGFMPNKTIYIRDSDIEVWNKAQSDLGGESISSIVIDCLKDRLRSSRTTSSADVMREVLGHLNEVHNMRLELHPFWSPVILDANSLDIGYKVHQKDAQPDRVLSLIVDPFNFGASGDLNAAARSSVESAILGFWDGKRADQHAVVRIGAVDVLSRLLNLVGKHGLVKIAHAGELGFMILAVHPAKDLPESGDDADMEEAISRSDFTVQFDNDVVVDGADRKVISGRYISLIRGRY